MEKKSVKQTTAKQWKGFPSSIGETSLIFMEWKREYSITLLPTLPYRTKQRSFGSRSIGLVFVGFYLSKGEFAFLLPVHN